MSGLRLPTALTSEEPRASAYAIQTLQCYYGRGQHTSHVNRRGKWFRFTGALYDAWDSTGQRQKHVNLFTSDDVVAVSFLSVVVPPEAAIRLLQTESADFSALLEELGPDRDLVSESTGWADDWVGWRLLQKLRDLPGVGPTTASKLLARKRPRLRPIYDSVVAEVIGSENVWQPLREELQSDPRLHQRLLDLRLAAGLGDSVSALRIFDVLAWMQGTDKGCDAVREPVPR